MWHCSYTTAGIDISVGPSLALSACAMGVVFKSGITNPLILILTALIVGACCGVVNGLLLTKLRLPAERRSDYRKTPRKDFV